ncbi:endolytic transglycosylase MltG [Desertibacillus haloalkaliphilus]|uniref:endolytic transglycosylase MltG n=1 Tax=Desertibacillus haloalkaliphilus TaxID=1328930 RepID=UPI001C2726F4|nr:endolytic transglycosylase MltG [Desertibacillus haloalkaliphilus]MBU8905540.1 endolytic transglycosylase MltG [Desertibacillus haloalkaliphilus]
MKNENQDTQDDGLTEQVKQARIVRKIVFITVIVLVIAVAVIGLSGYLYVKSALGPVDETNTELVDVHIPIGSSSTQIGNILEEESLIKNSTFFRYYVRYNNETGFQAGDYQLNQAMTLGEIIEELKEGTLHQEPELTFTIPEGLWLEDIVTTIAEHTTYDQAEIEEVFADRDMIEELIANYDLLTDDILAEGIKQPLEGYLFPARYDFLDEDMPVEQIITSMIERTSDVITKYEQDVNDSVLSIHELLTLASIIEREAQTSEDRYLISGVLYNRLDQGMPLQVDPTVAYAIGEHRYMTSYADLEVDSPYNTYKYPGIPIGPIANPGEDAIRAALQPESTDYLYFYARRNGEVIYNTTYREHHEVHQEYRHEWVEAGE